MAKKPSPLVHEISQRLGVKISFLKDETLPEGLKKSPISSGCIDPVRRIAYLYVNDSLFQMVHEMVHCYLDPPGHVIKFPEQIMLLQCERELAKALLPPEDARRLIRNQQSAGFINNEAYLYLPFEDEPWWKEGLELGVRVGVLAPKTYAATLKRPNWTNVPVAEIAANPPKLPECYPEREHPLLLKLREAGREIKITYLAYVHREDGFEAYKARVATRAAAMRAVDDYLTPMRVRKGYRKKVETTLESE